jgi:hypothetical protein
VDPVANSRRQRPERLPQGGATQPVSFDPGCTTRIDPEDVSDDEQEDLDAIF